MTMYKIYSHPSTQGGRQQSKKQQSSTQKGLVDDKNLEVAVDHVLLEHVGRLPKKKHPQLRVTRRDSYSTISTDPGFPDTTLCHVVCDERRGRPIPLEVSFQTADADYSLSHMPLMQKSKFQRLPDSRNVPDFYEDDDFGQDIVFIPADAEAASVTSSMEVVRKISSRYTDSDDIDEILCKAAARASSSVQTPSVLSSPAHSTTAATATNNNNNGSARRCGVRSGMHRAPSMGLDDIAGKAPPVRQGIHQLSFHVPHQQRAEF